MPLVTWWPTGGVPRQHKALDGSFRGFDPHVPIKGDRDIDSSTPPDLTTTIYGMGKKMRSFLIWKLHVRKFNVRSVRFARQASSHLHRFLYEQMKIECRDWSDNWLPYLRLFFQIGKIQCKLPPDKWLDILCWSQTVTPFTITCRVSMVVKMLASWAREVFSSNPSRGGGIANKFQLGKKLYLIKLFFVNVD